MKRRTKRAMPQMILWDRRSQTRFIDAVEKLVSFVGDLELLLDRAKRRRRATPGGQGHEPKEPANGQ